MVKSDPTFKAQWIAALRSGEYTQGQDALKRTYPVEGVELAQGCDPASRHCCLGVAADLLHKEQPDVFDWDVNQLKNVAHAYPYVSGDNLPYIFMEAKLSSDTTEPAWDLFMRKLVELNDMDNWSFNQIADYIEENG